MNESLRGAIEEAEKALATKMAEVKQRRTTINQLNKMLGQAPPYAATTNPPVRAVCNARPLSA